MEIEWQALLDALSANRALLAEESARLTQALWDDSNVLRLDLDDFITGVVEWLDERLLHEGHELQAFLKGYGSYLNQFNYQPVGWNVVRPVFSNESFGFAKTKIIEESIFVFGDNIQADFDAIAW